MPVEPKIPVAVVPLTFIAGLLSLLCSLYGAAVIAFGGEDFRYFVRDIVPIIFIHLRLLAFPIFLTSHYSMRTCRNWFSAYFIVDFLFCLIFYRQEFGLNHLYFFVPEIAVFLAVGMLNAAYLLVRHTIRGSNEKIPGFINIMTR